MERKESFDAACSSQWQGRVTPARSATAARRQAGCCAAAHLGCAPNGRSPLQCSQCLGKPPTSIGAAALLPARAGGCACLLQPLPQTQSRLKQRLHCRWHARCWQMLQHCHPGSCLQGCHPAAVAAAAARQRQRPRPPVAPGQADQTVRADVRWCGDQLSHQPAGRLRVRACCWKALQRGPPLPAEPGCPHLLRAPSGSPQPLRQRHIRALQAGLPGCRGCCCCSRQNLLGRSRRCCPNRPLHRVPGWALLMAARAWQPPWLPAGCCRSGPPVCRRGGRPAAVSSSAAEQGSHNSGCKQVTRNQQDHSHS